MVTASFAPLAALVLARLAGASALTAANFGLATAVVLLTVHGWAAGRAVKLRGLPLFFAASVVAGAGIGDGPAEEPERPPPALTGSIFIRQVHEYLALTPAEGNGR